MKEGPIERIENTVCSKVCIPYDFVQGAAGTRECDLQRQRDAEHGSEAPVGLDSRTESCPTRGRRPGAGQHRSSCEFNTKF